MLFGLILQSRNSSLWDITILALVVARKLSLATIDFRGERYTGLFLLLLVAPPPTRHTGVQRNVTGPPNPNPPEQPMSMEDFKANKKKYGKTMAPIPCTRAFVKPMGFDHKEVKTQSFILINDNPSPKFPQGSRTHVNLYDGGTGAGFDADQATHALGDEKTIKKKLRDYKPCQITDCPVAIAVQPTAPPPPATGDVEIEDIEVAEEKEEDVPTEEPPTQEL